MECSLKNRRLFIAVLQSLALESSKDFIIESDVSSKGLQFAGSTKSKDVNVRCWIKAGFFRYFSLDDTSYSFALYLQILINSLQIFGMNADMTFIYCPSQQAISLELKEGDAKSECKISTMARTLSKIQDNALQLNLEEYFVVRPDLLRKCLIDLSDMSVEGDPKVELIARPGDTTVEPVVSFIMNCTGTFTKIDLPGDEGIFNAYKIHREHRFCYSLKALMAMQKALTFSSAAHFTTIATGLCVVTMLVKHQSLEELSDEIEHCDESVIIQFSISPLN